MSSAMDKRFLYVGCFPDPKEFAKKISGIDPHRLERIIAHPHVTFVFAPKHVDTSLFGQRIRIRITGYGKNDKNEGVAVTLRSEDPTLQRMIDDIPVPHITISVGENGVPVETRYLEFRSISPIELSGVFGGMTSNNRVITQKNFQFEE